MPVDKRIKFSTFFASGHYETQVERLEVLQKGKGAVIGVPKERYYSENRVPLIPNSIRSLIGYGHRVIVESSAGARAHFKDEDYIAAGATVTRDREKVFEANIIIKFSPPSIEEFKFFSPGQILLTPLPLPFINAEYLQKVKEKRITAIAMDQIFNEDGTFPIVRIMSEMAGRIAILTAAELLSSQGGGRGVLLGGVSGVPPAKVVILGAGMVGIHATKTALSLGASVRIFDNDINKIIRIQDSVGHQLHTSSINPEYMAYQLTSADVVVAALHSKKGRSPILVTEEMVTNMKEGSVLMDLSIDQGGCVETSRPTTTEEPTYVEHGVIHYCVPNITSKVPRTSSAGMSNIITPLILKILAPPSLPQVLFREDGLRFGVYAHQGFITNQYLAERFAMKYTAIELILTGSRES